MRLVSSSWFGYYWEDDGAPSRNRDADMFRTFHTEGGWNPKVDILSSELAAVGVAIGVAVSVAVDVAVGVAAGVAVDFVVGLVELTHSCISHGRAG